MCCHPRAHTKTGQFGCMDGEYGCGVWIGSQRPDVNPRLCRLRCSTLSQLISSLYLSFLLCKRSKKVYHVVFLGRKAVSYIQVKL